MRYPEPPFSPELEETRKDMMNATLQQFEQTRAMFAAVFGPTMAQSIMISLLLYGAAGMTIQAAPQPEELWRRRTASAWKSAVLQEIPTTEEGSDGRQYKN